MLNVLYKKCILNCTLTNLKYKNFFYYLYLSSVFLVKYANNKTAIIITVKLSDSF